MPELVESTSSQPIYEHPRFKVIVTTISVGLILIISSSVAYYLIQKVNQEVLSRPHSDYLEWQDDFRTISGLDNVTGLTGSGVRTCVVDTGIEIGHVDFAGKQLTGWKDFINDRSEPYDDQGHGTAMAGLIWADGWMRGVSPGVELLVAKAMGSTGEGVDDTIAAAVDWCVSQSADIISLSLGGAPGFNFILGSTDQLEESVQDALDAGIFVVAAAGNDGTDDDGDVESPGSIEDVICVGAIDRTGQLWSGSSIGDNNGHFLSLPFIAPRFDPDRKPELVAPGEDVPVLLTEGGGFDTAWGHASGTSASTAWVAGALGLLLEQRADLQHDGSSGGSGAIGDVKDWIQSSSVGQSGHDDHYGYGYLDTSALLAAAV